MTPHRDALPYGGDLIVTVVLKGSSEVRVGRAEGWKCWRNGGFLRGDHLEDHPRTCKWLVTMVSKSPKWGYSPYKWPKWLINGGDPNYLLTGMILQAGWVGWNGWFQTFFLFRIGSVSGYSTAFGMVIMIGWVQWGCQKISCNWMMLLIGVCVCFFVSRVKYQQNLDVKKPTALLQIL